MTPVDPSARDVDETFLDLFASGPDTGPSPAAEAPTSDVISVDECARWLGVNKKTVYDAANRRELPCARLGRRVLLSRAAITEWLSGRRA